MHNFNIKLLALIKESVISSPFSGCAIVEFVYILKTLYS
jgi:hypothetical protein